MAQTSSQSLGAALSGLAFRNNLNTILAALFSASSGATAPSPTVGGQLWLDTGVSPPVLRMMNTANTGWIPVSPETIPANTLRGNPTGAAAAVGGVTMAQLRQMQGYGQILANNGYFQLFSGGPMIQWLATGAAGSGSNGSVAFPVSFPTACTGIWCQYANTGGDAAVGDNYVAQVRAVGTGGFTIRNLGPASAVYFVLAVGY